MGRFYEQRIMSYETWLSRYVFGFVMFPFVLDFIATRSRGIDRRWDPNINWPWWNHIMAMKRNGEINPYIPGYAFAKYKNSAEQEWMENLDPEALVRERAERRKRYYHKIGQEVPKKFIEQEKKFGGTVSESDHPSGSSDAVHAHH